MLTSWKSGEIRLRQGFSNLTVQARPLANLLNSGFRFGGPGREPERPHF